MTHVPVRTPCGARVAGLMFLSDCPAAAGVDGIRAELYNQGILTSPGSVRAADAPFPVQGRGRLRFSFSSFSCTLTTGRPLAGRFGLGGDPREFGVRLDVGRRVKLFDQRPTIVQRLFGGVEKAATVFCGRLRTAPPVAILRNPTGGHGAPSFCWISSATLSVVSSGSSVI